MKMNYYDWAALVKVMLQARGLWMVVSAGTEDYTKDRMALEVITKAVPPELLGLSRVRRRWRTHGKRSPYTMWGRSRAESEGKFPQVVTFLDGELIYDFAAWLGRVTNQLPILGFEYKEEEIVHKFLQPLLPKFEQIATSIETLLDLGMVIVYEWVGRLKPSKERINRNGGGVLASLNLIEDELVSKISWRLKITGGGNTDLQKEGSSSGGKWGWGHDHGRGTGDRGHGDGNAGRGSNTTGDECRYCGKRRHWAHECRKKKRDEQAHAVQVEDDGKATLLVACTSVDVEPTVSATTEVHLNEDKLFVQLSDKKGGITRWILDMGATNHMTGERSTFSELDTKVHGSVRFGDNSIVGIEGRSTMMLKCKNGEHKALTTVYHIPWLTASIVSLGQLEEDGYQILLFGGYLKIWDVKGRLMAKVERATNWLHVMELNIACPVCLAA
jgi:hypothetical protein